MPLLSVSHQQQRQQADCLAACAAMLLDYLHIPVRYSRLLSLLEVSAIGTSFGKLRNLETLGLSVRVEGGDIETLQGHLSQGLPVIAFVDTGQLTTYWAEQTDHAVVVVGIEGEFVYLNDPAFPSGPQMPPLREFELAWEEKDFLYGLIALE